MCDCSQECDDKVSEKVHPETITIFSKCLTPYRPGKDIFRYAPIDDADCKSIDFVQSNSSNSTRKTSTVSSSESSRTYKFIYPTKCDYTGEGEEDKLPPVCFEIDRIKSIKKEPDIECTLAIIKPEAVVYRKEIEHRIYTEGFEIYQTRWLQLTPEQASEFYSDHFGHLYFPHLIAYMSSGSIVVFVLAKQKAVEEWNKIIGPTKVTEARLYFPDSIRARYGRKGEIFKNAVHGSYSREHAEKEIHFFFPEFITEPLLKNEMAEDFLWEVINSVLIEGLVKCCKSKPADPVLWLAHWLILNNPNKPKLPEDLALIPT